MTDDPGAVSPVVDQVAVPPPATQFEAGQVEPAQTAENQADWGWVEEWRRGAEPTPWGPGLGLAGFAALIIGTAVYVISAGLADRPLIALVANVIVAAGLAPALWMSRQLPVLRWVSLGGAIGTVVAWISIVFFPNI